jgi:2-polyprenyl-3-methyl-5-hydroxy-6-metoxy-1,4-benzoquinol methylase
MAVPSPVTFFPVLRERDAEATETMDSPDCDPEILRRTYANFRYVNAVVSGWRTTYRRDIRPLLSASRESSLLDIGSGGGDVARSLARWAARDGLRLTVTAIDPDARAHDFASRLPPLPGLTFRRAFSSELVADGAEFDVVVSNHILHHLSARELGGLLFDSERLCRPGGRVLHSDIERTALGYVAFSAGTWPFFRNSYIRADGLTSIRRSYTVAELRAAVPSGWRISREVPSRLLLRFDRPLARVPPPLSPPSLPPLPSVQPPQSVEEKPEDSAPEPFAPGAAGPQSPVDQGTMDA